MTGTTSTSTPTPTVGRARLAVLVVFAVNGFAFASWAGRLPETKTILDLSAGELGTTLLFMSVASVVALPLAGALTDRIGAARAVALGAGVSLLGLAAAGVAIEGLQSRTVLAGALVLYGLGLGVWDVSMNLEGALVERRLGRTVMPHFHAAFSGGTVLGGLCAVLLSRLGAPVSWHLAAVALGVGVAVVFGVRAFLPRTGEADVAPEAAADDRADGPQVAEPEQGRSSAASAWLEPRTLLIGLVVFAAAFTEGTANDWLAIALVEGHDVQPWLGTLAFAVFLTAMTLARLLGTRLLDRYGRVAVLRVMFVLALVGSLLVVFGSTALAFVGAVVWGLGAALGFPVGMSASADDPRRAAARMSVVSTIGYGAFIAGPPFLGYLGDHVGVLRSLLVLSVLVLLALLALPAVREPERRAS